jgi:CRISPR-associated endonuclease Csn1
MEKNYILGVDPGTGSLGLFLRDTDEEDLLDQIKYSSVDVVKSGVIESGLNKYTSFAAERRGYRSSRKRYLHRRWRKQATLKLLISSDVLDNQIKFPLCPLSNEELERWIKYDKKKGLKREYPVGNKEFARWMKMDFDNDGKADYSSPYQLRKVLAEEKLDFSVQENCYKLGRAIYHIAQRRGFKSSKGDSLGDVDIDVNETVTDSDDFDALEYSEKKKSRTLETYRKEHDYKTVGCALAALECEGVRLRDSKYQAIRSQLRDEIKIIFETQGLSKDLILFKRLISEKKYEGTIFYQYPPRSQKGNVEHCSLEPLKKRCLVSHPEFEKYRAWSFINNVKVRLPEESEAHCLSLELRQKLYGEISTHIKTFEFKAIRKRIEHELNIADGTLSAQDKSINFRDDYTINGCPTIVRLQKILGDSWESWQFDTGRVREKRNGTKHTILYDALTLWHVCANAENEAYIQDFVTNIKDTKTNQQYFNEGQTKEIIRLYKNLSDEYSKLSLSALKKINHFLVRGFNNYEATLLANIPTLIGEHNWEKNREEIETTIQQIIDDNREKRRIIRIANNLISDYYSLHDGERFIEDKKLNNDDYEAIKARTKEMYGTKVWNTLNEKEQTITLRRVAQLYQQFFHSKNPSYYKAPTDLDSVCTYLHNSFDIPVDVITKLLYTPYDNNYYPKAELSDGCYQLCSPAKGSNHNPAAMRILYLMRRRINSLLKDRDLGITDDNTRVVVELPREMNDANQRRAIELYQERRKKENKIFCKMIGLTINENDEEDEILQENDRLQKVRLLIEQNPDYLLADFSDEYQRDKDPNRFTRNFYNEKIEYADRMYRRWLQHGCIDLYSGNEIPFSELFDENQYDIDHTVPRSIILSDGLENKTITSALFNRRIKENRLPTQLQNYQSVVLPNLRCWQERVEHLQERVAYWLKETKRANDPERKNECIVQRHVWQMELDYWIAKLERFTITEVTPDFVQKQMSDTRVISKYVFHYLKSFFKHVEMQYGRTTAIFRNIYGLPAKDRNNHIHHVIDAATLSFIPSSRKRDEMLNLYFLIKEAEEAGSDTEALNNSLQLEITESLFGRSYRKDTDKKFSDLAQYLRETTLVRHVEKDQALTPARKKGTLRKNGESIPIIKTGDSLRGRIHKDSFFGAINPWATDDKGFVIKDENGQPIWDESKTIYVKRIKLQVKKGKGEGFTSWEDLYERIVDKALYWNLRNQFEENISFDEACKKGFLVERKVNGRIVRNTIRHVRSKIAGNLSHVPIKRHLKSSVKPYKQWCYAESADLQYACEYKGKTETAYRLYSLYDISQNRKQGEPDIPQVIPGKKEILHLERIITQGDMVLLYDQSPEELVSLDSEQKSLRLYRISGFEKNSTRIKLIKHNVAKVEKKEFKSYPDFHERILSRAIMMSLNAIKFVVCDCEE